MTLKQLEQHVKRLQARADKQERMAEETKVLLKRACIRLAHSRQAGRVVPDDGRE